MNADAYRQILDDFFSPNDEQLVEVFRELLAAVRAEGQLPPGGLMSRNYATAQANPEIHTLPGNLRDARDAVFPFFWGTDAWNSPLHLENVKGPTNLASLVGAIACLLKNPNLCVDTYCLRSNELEVKAVTALANLIFYHTDSPWGVFTMGGTISNLYGGKIGIEKVAPGTMRRGLAACEAPVVGFVSEAAHYSNATLAGWLGIGTDHLISVPVDAEFAMRTERLAELLEEAYAAGRKVAFVIATFGSTDAFGIDDVVRIRGIVEDAAARHDAPVPHLHVDAAVGWVLCFLADYDRSRNVLDIAADTLPLVEKAQAATLGFRQADSVCLDFHKMGWGHYPGSAFIVNRRDDLRHLLRGQEDMPYFSEADYRHDPALFTLECSRPAIGPYSVMASLNGLGLRGYQMLVVRAMELAARLKRKLAELDNCVVLNPTTPGPSVVWWVLPKGRDARDIYRKWLAGELSADAVARFGYEIRRLFEKRQQSLVPMSDARLSFTSNPGFKAHGHAMPAWKAVFFNPHTDEAIIDRIAAGIAELL